MVTCSIVYPDTFIELSRPSQCTAATSSETQLSLSFPCLRGHTARRALSPKFRNQETSTYELKPETLNQGLYEPQLLPGVFWEVLLKVRGTNPLGSCVDQQLFGRYSCFQDVQLDCKCSY